MDELGFSVGGPGKFFNFSIFQFFTEGTLFRAEVPPERQNGVKAMSLKTAGAFFISSILLVMFLPVTSGAVQKDPFGPEHAPFTPPEELIGNSLSDFTFTDQDGKDFTLGEAFGRPLIISFIYTKCHHACPISETLTI
jgi:cytochrome oxidase Cu insertion factor (SCO1/SenC/PrrC family)